MSNNIIRLRPHHGLCIKHFVGTGYSEEYTANMTEIIKRLNDGADIKLLSEKEAVHGDDICKHCPNIADTGCSSEEHVKVFDGGVIKYTGLFDTEILSYKEFDRVVCENIIDAGLMKDVCGDSGWSMICHKN